MRVADIVIIDDMGVAGIIERVTVYDDMTVASVRTVTGALYAREDTEVTMAAEQVAEQFRADVELLVSVDGRKHALGMAVRLIRQQRSAAARIADYVAAVNPGVLIVSGSALAVGSVSLAARWLR